MKRFILIVSACLALAACKSEEQRAHEQVLQRQQLQHEFNLRQQELRVQAQAEALSIAAQERSRALKVEAFSERIGQLFSILGVVGGIVAVGGIIAVLVRYVIGLLEARLRLIRDTRMAEAKEYSQRHRHFVDAIMNPENGMSEHAKQRAIEAAAKAISGYLPYDPSVGQ